MIQVYNCHYTFLYFFPILGLLLFVGVTFRELKYFNSKEMSNNGLKMLKCIFVAFILIVITIFLILLIWGYISEYFRVYCNYKNNNCMTVDGVVSEYDHSDFESFVVDGIEFKYYDKELFLGYHKTEYNGGFICGNGQHVRIKYISFGDRNVIVELWVEETENNRQ
ncbi:MAG: hypothetical protein E7294_06485 [Lachnospiraceae bacterium]|nr:hypothetical protein [Lachnospiraceae bacterium]